MADAYESRYAGLVDHVTEQLARLAPADQDPAEVARRIVEVVDTVKGQRPFRVHVDPAHDGAEEVFDLGDRIRASFYARTGLEDLLGPSP